MDSLQSLAFESLTSPSSVSGYSVLLAACVEGNYEEVRNIFSFSPSLLDTLIALKTPALEKAGPVYVGKTPRDIVVVLGTLVHQAILKILKQHAKGMEKQSLIHLAARVGTVRHIRQLVSRGAKINCKSCDRNDEFATPLCLAAAYNKIEIVEEFVRQGAKLYRRFIHGYNAAHFAAKNGCTENLLYLLDKKYELRNSHVNSQVSLLHLAAYGGHVDMVSTLIAIGLDVNMVNGYYVDSDVELGYVSTDTELYDYDNHYDYDNDSERQSQNLDNSESKSKYDEDPDCSSEYGHDFGLFTEGATPLMVAARNGHIETVELLISKGANIHLTDENFCSALFYAAYGGHSQLIQCLIKAGLKVDTLDEYDRSLLHVVTNVETADLLISKHGLKVQTLDDNKGTALHHAVAFGDINLVNLYLHHGADINAWDGNGETPLVIALSQKHLNPELVAFILNNGSLLNCSSCEYASPIHCVIDKATCKSTVLLKVIETLLNHGCDVLGVNDSGESALHLASKGKWESSSVMKLLIDKGNRITAVDNMGNTPLHVAAYSQQTDNVKFLIDCEMAARDDCQKAGMSMGPSSVHKRNHKGQTPLHRAVSCGSAELTRMLLEYGSDVHAVDRYGKTPLHCAAGDGC